MKRFHGLACYIKSRRVRRHSCRYTVATTIITLIFYPDGFLSDGARTSSRSLAARRKRWYTGNGFFPFESAPSDAPYPLRPCSPACETSRIHLPTTNPCDLTFTVVSERNDQRDAFHFSLGLIKRVLERTRLSHQATRADR